MMYSDMDIFKEETNRALDHLKAILAKARTGVADKSLIRTLKVDYYGSHMELYQIASITTPEPRLLVVKPYSKADVKSILKSIQESSLNLNPTDTEDTIRIVISPLTREVKTQIIRDLKKQGENTKITLRNLRRKALDEIEDEESLSDSEKKSQKTNIQNELNKITTVVEDLLKEKIKQIEGV